MSSSDDATRMRRSRIKHEINSEEDVQEGSDSESQEEESFDDEMDDGDNDSKEEGTACAGFVVDEAGGDEAGEEDLSPEEAQHELKEQKKFLMDDPSSEDEAGQHALKDNEDLKKELDMTERQQLNDVLATLRGRNSNTNELEKRWVLHGKEPGKQYDYDLPADTLVTANQTTLTELWGARGETEFVPPFVAAKEAHAIRQQRELVQQQKEWQQKIREDMNFLVHEQDREHMSTPARKSIGDALRKSSKTPRSNTKPLAEASRSKDVEMMDFDPAELEALAQSFPETQKRTRATSMQPNDPEDLIDQAEEFLPSFQCRFEDILLTLPHICTRLNDTDRPMCSVYETDTGHLFPCLTLKVIMQWPGSESQHTMLSKQVDADTDAQKLYQVGPFDFLIPEEQCINKKHAVINHSREDADGQGDAVFRTAKRQIKTAGTFLLPACIWSVANSSRSGSEKPFTDNNNAKWKEACLQAQRFENARRTGSNRANTWKFMGHTMDPATAWDRPPEGTKQCQTYVLQQILCHVQNALDACSVAFGNKGVFVPLMQ